MVLVCACCLAGAQQAALPATAAVTEPVSVMVVGLFHMANPGHDVHNIAVDDVLAPKRQAEIAAVSDSLGAFHPSKVMVEWPADFVDEQYPKFLAGTLPPSRNEVVQLGFRLARKAGLPRVYGIDVDGEFPFEAVQTFAKTHGQEAVLAQANADVELFVQRITHMLQVGGIASALRVMNDPAEIRKGNEFYSEMLRLGQGAEQPGVTLLSAWQKRNLLICANLVQNSRPGDHVVVFYGAGHAFLLRQCVTEVPGFRLVEPNAYLPQS